MGNRSNRHAQTNSNTKERAASKSTSSTGNQQNNTKPVENISLQDVRLLEYDHIGGEYNLSALGIQQDVLIPEVILACVQFLRTDQRMNTEGLFRVPGDYQQLCKVQPLILVPSQELLITPQTLEQLDCSVPIVCSLLKLFLRQLEPPLIPYTHFETFIDIQSTDQAQQAINSLPSLNKGIFAYLCCFLAQVTSRSDSTRMSAESLSLLFAPQLFRNKTVEMQQHPSAFLRLIGRSSSSLVKCIEFAQQSSTTI